MISACRVHNIIIISQYKNEVLSALALIKYMQARSVMLAS